MILFLHDLGYDFFDIPKLTYPEINLLIRAKNRKVKKEEQEAKRAKMKAKRGKRR